MATPQQAAQALLALIVNQGGRVGRSYGFVTGGSTFTLSRVPGALQAAFLNGGYAVSDLAAGLSYAVQQGWLSTGNNYDGWQEYILEVAGFTEAGGTAPAIAASAQQLINVAAGINATPGAARFDLASFGNSFIGTVGGNVFAAEDLMPAYGYAISEDWVRPCGRNLFDPVFCLTAAGAAAAS